MIEFIQGNIFDSDCQGIVNCVNCLGISGAGLALQFKKKYPDMYVKYKDICDKGLLSPGAVFPWRTPLMYGKVIFNLATKYDWRKPSKYQWIQKGLEEIDYCMKEYVVGSLAFPKIGCGLGGLDYEVVKAMIQTHHDKYWQKIYITVYE